MNPFDSMLLQHFAAASPHMRKIGLEIVSLSAGVCVAKLPYRAEFVGDATTGVFHGGVVTSLLDTTGGAAALSCLGEPIPLATLDLRIDYLRPSRPGRGVVARVECYKQTYNVAFARGIAYDELESDPIAAMAATYMLRTQAVRTAGNV